MFYLSSSTVYPQKLCIDYRCVTARVAAC